MLDLAAASAFLKRQSDAASAFVEYGFQSTSRRVSNSRQREPRWHKLQEDWQPLIVKTWKDAEAQISLLTDGRIEGDVFNGLVIGLSLLLLLLLLPLRIGRRRNRSRLRSIQVDAYSAGNGSDTSSITPDGDEDDERDRRLRPLSSNSRASSSPSVRSTRVFGVGTASRRNHSIDRRTAPVNTQLIRITSSDPSSRLSLLPLQLDLASPPTKRSGSPGHAAAMAALARRRKKQQPHPLARLGGSTDSQLDAEEDEEEEEEQQIEDDDGSEDFHSLAGHGDEGEDSDGSPGLRPTAATSSKIPRVASPLGRNGSTTRPSLSTNPRQRRKRAFSPVGELPDPIPERNSSYHKEGVVAIKTNLVTARLRDVPPSILRKDAQQYGIPALARIMNSSSGTGGASVERSDSLPGSLRRSNDMAAVPEDASVDPSASSSSSPFHPPDEDGTRTGRRLRRSSSDIEAWRAKEALNGRQAAADGPLTLTSKDKQGRRKDRAIKLTEPDWEPYAASHYRARERIEKKKETMQKRNTRSRSSSNSGPATPDEGLQADIGGSWLAYAPIHSPDDSMVATSSSSMVQAPPRRSFSSSALPDVALTASSSRAGMQSFPVDRREQAEEEEEEFWFERFTTSTAAAGRDWDWRKRRARETRRRVTKEILAMESKINGEEAVEGSGEEDEEEEEGGGWKMRDVND